MVVVGPLTVCAVCYAVHRHRERAEWAKVREEQREMLEQLERLGWYKKKIG